MTSNEAKKRKFRQSRQWKAFRKHMTDKFNYIKVVSPTGTGKTVLINKLENKLENKKESLESPPFFHVLTNDCIYK